jgi:hypothetical protein|tara:strand:+ start:8296 stop:9450 length:1155 start_codon:yes stop_codon:yes gene_type:complete
MYLIDLKFDFSNPDSITFYGDEVSGFRNDLGTVKAFVHGEEEFALWNREDSQLVVPTEKSTKFIFKPTINLVDDFEIKLDFEIGDDFESTFLFGSKHAQFTLTKGGVLVKLNIDDEITLPFNHLLTKGQHVIYISRVGGIMLVEQEGDSSTAMFQIEFEEAVLIESFLGGISKGEVRYNSISLTENVEEQLSTTIKEVVEKENEIKTPEAGVKLDKDSIETKDSVEEIANKTNLGEEAKNETHNIKDMKELTNLEKQMISGYEGVLKAVKGTKVGKYYKTEGELKQEASENKVFLVKVFYYILADQPEWGGSSHAEIKTRAYELFEMFEKGDAPEGGRRYGFSEGVVYKSFKYGKITDLDLTDELVVELLMEEYEGVRMLIIKK